MKPIADQTTTAVAETVEAKPQSLARRGFLASAAAGVAAATATAAGAAAVMGEGTTLCDAVQVQRLLGQVRIRAA